MFLFEAVIDNADCGQLLVIKDKLAHLDQRVDEILPMSQFNIFVKPQADQDHPQEIDIWVAIDGELTAPQLARLEQEVESSIGRIQSSPSTPGPRIVEKLIQL